jgi:transcriptional regulator of acetoin/glycerol metabolism
MPCMEISGAMHLVREIPVEDDSKLGMLSRCFAHQAQDATNLWEFARNAYKIGRETEARRHQCFVLGTLADVEKISILRAMEASGRNPLKAAKLLDIGKTTMYRKLKEYGVSYGEKANKPDPDAGQ